MIPSYVKLFKIFERIKCITDDNGKIYIRGSGAQGRSLFEGFRKLGVTAYAFLDNNPAFHGKEACGIPILNPSSLYSLEKKGNYFIACSMADEDAYHITRQEMELNGLKEGVDFADFGLKFMLRMNYDWEDFAPSNIDHNIKRKLTNSCNHIYYSDIRGNALSDFEFDTQRFEEDNFISMLDFVVTEYCNLKCKYCSHAIPLCKSPKHLSPDLIVSDLDKLLSICGVLVVGIMGGESLLHPQLADILDEVARMENIQNVGCFRIVTNGTMDIPDEVLISMKKISRPIYIYVSNYTNYSSKSTNIEEKCASHGITCYIQAPDRNWHVFGDPGYSRNVTEARMKDIFSVCAMAGICNQLFDGKFYSCGRLPMLNENNIIPYDEKLFCDIRNTSLENLEDLLYNFIYNTQTLSGCQYCDGSYEISPVVPKGL